MKKVYMPDINVQHVAIGGSHGLVLESIDRGKQVFIVAASGEPGRMSEAAKIMGDAIQAVARLFELESKREIGGLDADKFSNR